LDSSLAGSRFKLYDYILYVEKPDGTVWGCSKYGNSNGELTITGSFATLQLLPAIPSIDNVYLSDSSSSSNFVFVKKADGTVWRCGINSAGQLGTGDFNYNYTRLINLDASFDNPNKIAVGGDFAIIEKSDGTVWATGENNYGQLGLGDNINRNVFTQIPGILNPNKITCTTYSLFIEKSDGTVWSTGNILEVNKLTIIL
jgi:alpha-tubulin suppressor-like RCC1 family protein